MEIFFFDFNPLLFRHLLNQLQLFDNNFISPPSDRSLVLPFQKMMTKLGLGHLLLSDKNVITFNTDGQIITSQRTTFNQLITEVNHTSEIFVDHHPKLFRHFIKQIREKSFKHKCDLISPSNEERKSFNQMVNDFKICGNYHKK